MSCQSESTAGHMRPVSSSVLKAFLKASREQSMLTPDFMAKIWLYLFTKTFTPHRMRYEVNF